MLSPSHLIFMLQVKIKFRLNFNFDLQHTLPPLPPHKNFLLDKFSVHTVNYRPSFLLSIFGPSAKRGTINLWKKMRIHNLQWVWLEKNEADKMFIIWHPVWENWKQVQIKQFDRQGSQEKSILLVHENNSTSHLGSLTKVKSNWWCAMLKVCSAVKT